MKFVIEKYIVYLQSVRNSSPHTVLNYRKDLEQFLAYLSPPGANPPALKSVTHGMIREFVAHLHEQRLAKSSIARKLAALRSFFKYCVREGQLKENPARLVPTPKLPKRIPSVLSAEEMNGFLNELGGMAPASGGPADRSQKPPHAGFPEERTATKRSVPPKDDQGLFLRRDRALLELLYAAGLRVSELTGLNSANECCGCVVKATKSASFPTVRKLRRHWKGIGRYGRGCWSKTGGKMLGCNCVPGQCS